MKKVRDRIDDAGIDGASFLTVGGHPCLDFINTLPNRDGAPHEMLRSYGDLARFVEEGGLVDVGEIGRLRDAKRDAAAHALEAAHALRDTLRALVESLADGQPLAEDAVRALDDRLADVTLRQRLVADASASSGFGVVERPYFETPADLLAPIAMAGAALVASGGEGRIRRCEHPRCVLFFYDTSRNRSRRWCDMATCGNRLKAARHYQRRRRGLGGVSR